MRVEGRPDAREEAERPVVTGMGELVRADEEFGQFRRVRASSDCALQSVIKDNLPVLETVGNNGY